MSEPIAIEVTFDGADQAAEGAQRIARSLEDMARRQEAAARQAAEFAGKVAAASGQVANFGRAIGSQAVEAVGTLTGQIAQSVQQFTELGMRLGPQGAIVGGIAGAVIPVVGRLGTAIQETNERNQEWTERLGEITRAQEDMRQALDDTNTELDEHNEALATAAERSREFVQSLTTGGLTSSAQDAAARISVLSDRLAEVNDQIAGLAANPGRAAARLLDLREEAANLAEEINALSAEIETTQAMATRRRGGGGDSYAEEQEQIQRSLMAVYQEQREEARLANRDEQERLDALAQKTREIIELEEHYKQKLNESHEEAKQLAEQRAEAMEAANEKAVAAKEKLEETNRQQREQYMETTQVLTGGLTDALSAILAGTASAEDAFRSLLSSFLKFVSEKAALQAAFEFAEAIAAYSRYDFGSGTSHLAAGFAYTAVAVSAGAGSIVAAPSAAKPQEGQSSSDKNRREGRGGGDLVINFSQPVVTAATRAELGRELRGLIQAGDQRYGAH